MDYILQTNGLTKKYKNFQTLNDLSMNVPKCSIYGFVGKNGATVIYNGRYFRCNRLYPVPRLFP